MLEQPSDRLIAGREVRAHDISSLCCTGGTTGAPKIAVRTHRNEVFELLGCGEDDGRRGVAPDRPLWIATIPRQWPARDRPSALDARRPRGSRHARRLSSKERDRPVLGDRRSFPGRSVLGSPNPLRGLAGHAGRRQRPVQPRIRYLRGSADAGGPHLGFRGEDGGEDHRRIRPDGRRLRFRSQPARRRTVRGFRRSAPPFISGWRPSCWTAKAASTEWPTSTRSASSRSTGPTCLQVISILVITKASGSTSTAKAGSTPAISADGMRTAISGYRAQEGAHNPGGHNIDPKIIEDALRPTRPSP